MTTIRYYPWCFHFDLNRLQEYAERAAGHAGQLVKLTAAPKAELVTKEIRLLVAEIRQMELSLLSARAEDFDSVASTIVGPLESRTGTPCQIPARCAPDLHGTNLTLFPCGHCKTLPIQML